MPEVDRHDTSAIYRKITLAELQREVPELKWRKYLQATLGAIPLNDNEILVSYAMPYLKQMGRILAETDRRVIHNYILWRLVSDELYDGFSLLIYLSLHTTHILLQVMSIMTHMIDDYQRERVEFRKILLGIQSERHRW
jgi:neprilysin